MSQLGNFSDGEFETVIAAAAYAITSLDERENLHKQRESVKFSGETLPKSKSKNEDTKIKLTSFGGSFKRWFSDQEPKEDAKPKDQDAKPGVSGGSFKRKSASTEQMNLEGSSANHNIAEKAMYNIPSIKKKPSFTDKHLNDTGSKRTESGKEMRPGQEMRPGPPRVPSTKSFPTSSFGNRSQAGNSPEQRKAEAEEMKPGPPRVPSTKSFPTSSFGNRSQAGYSPEQSKAEADADAWEKEQMIKIKKRYDKMMTTIMEWENERKAKAKSRLERKQNEPEQSRARALKKYEDEISRIEKVAGEARALAEERMRNDETKARVKAEKIRSTGKIPQTYCCC